MYYMEKRSQYAAWMFLSFHSSLSLFFSLTYFPCPPCSFSFSFNYVSVFLCFTLFLSVFSLCLFLFLWLYLSVSLSFCSFSSFSPSLSLFVEISYFLFTASFNFFIKKNECYTLWDGCLVEWYALWTVVWNFDIPRISPRSPQSPAAYNVLILYSKGTPQTFQTKQTTNNLVMSSRWRHIR